MVMLSNDLVQEQKTTQTTEETTTKEEEKIIKTIFMYFFWRLLIILTFSIIVWKAKSIKEYIEKQNIQNEFLKFVFKFFYVVLVGSLFLITFYYSIPLNMFSLPNVINILIYISISLIAGILLGEFIEKEGENISFVKSISKYFLVTLVLGAILIGFSFIMKLILGIISIGMSIVSAVIIAIIIFFIVLGILTMAQGKKLTQMFKSSDKKAGEIIEEEAKKTYEKGKKIGEEALKKGQEIAKKTGFWDSIKNFFEGSKTEE